MFSLGISVNVCREHESDCASLTVQFAICHQRATEGDCTDEGAEVRDYLGEVGGRVCGEVGVLDHVLCHAGEHGSQTHQAVEGRHQLGQLRDLDLLSNDQALRGAGEREITRK